MLWKLNRLAWASAAVLAIAGSASGASAAAVCPYVPALDVRPKLTEVAVDPQVLDAAAGVYKMDDYNLLNVLTVSRDGAHLSARFMGQPPATLLPASKTKFFYAGADSSITLNTDAAGHVTSLVLHRNHLKDIPLPRIDGAKAAQLEAQLAPRVDPQTGAPRSRPAFVHLLDGLMSGNPDYSKMGIQLNIAIHRQEGNMRSFLSDLGPVQSIQLLGFMDAGRWGVDGDTYDVWHKDGVSRWHVAVDGKGLVTSAAYRCGP
jgi:hypothetical protein